MLRVLDITMSRPSPMVATSRMPIIASNSEVPCSLKDIVMALASPGNADAHRLRRQTPVGQFDGIAGGQIKFDPGRDVHIPPGVPAVGIVQVTANPDFPVASIEHQAGGGIVAGSLEFVAQCYGAGVANSLVEISLSLVHAGAVCPGAGKGTGGSREQADDEHHHHQLHQGEAARLPAAYHDEPIAQAALAVRSLAPLRVSSQPAMAPWPMASST